VLNGSTSYDVTNYYEAVPSNALERVLWLEADRMRALKVDDENLKKPARRREGRSSRERHENQPYGGFPGLTCRRWRSAIGANAHNFYGDFADLDAADLKDVQAFFKNVLRAEQRGAVGPRDVKAEEGNCAGKKTFRRYSGGSSAAVRGPK